MDNEVIYLLIDEASIGKRLDKVCFDVLAQEYSRTQVQRLIELENILVNGLAKPSNYRVRINDKIEITKPEPVTYEVEPVNLNLNIVYEDEYVAVVDKPSGIAVHPANTIHEPTLVHGLMYQIKDLSGIGGVMRPGIVHRIDKDTSGLLMVAKNDIAHDSLVKQLRDKTVVRKYIALVYGNFDHVVGKIDAPIGRDKDGRLRMAVVADGKNAVTHFRVLERFEGFSLIECRLETGRTHQIRVHMAYIGHPLVGDPLYGPKKIIGDHGQFLHAQIIGFNHPATNKYLEFSSPLPDYFEDYLNELRKNH